MNLTFLGSAGAFAPEGRYWSAFLADGRHLFDAPPTLLPHLKKLGTRLAEIETIFITHYHGDHFAGLPFLMLEYVYLTPRTKDLVIVGPPGIEQRMEEYAERTFADVTRPAGYMRRYVEATPGREQSAGPVPFRAHQMSHGSGSMTALGYRAEIGGKKVAYTGDTMFCEEIFELAEGADVLVVDCTYPEGTGPEHMGLDDVREVRRRVPPAVPIILTHLNSAPDITGLDNVLVARDLAGYDVSEPRAKSLELRTENL